MPPNSASSYWYRGSEDSLSAGDAATIRRIMKLLSGLDRQRVQSASCRSRKSDLSFWNTGETGSCQKRAHATVMTYSWRCIMVLRRRFAISCFCLPTQLTLPGAFCHAASAYPTRIDLSCLEHSSAGPLAIEARRLGRFFITVLSQKGVHHLPPLRTVRSSSALFSRAVLSH